MTDINDRILKVGDTFEYLETTAKCTYINERLGFGFAETDLTEFTIN